MCSVDEIVSAVPENVPGPKHGAVKDSSDKGDWKGPFIGEFLYKPT